MSSEESRVKCLVVNLERDVRRMVDTKAAFDAAGMRFVRIDAVDARGLSREELSAACPKFRFYLANARRPRPGEVACALSHRKCWKEAFSDGTPVAAVFEDDVSFDAAQLKEHLDAIAAENDPSIPTAWLLHKGLPKCRAASGRWYDLLDTDDVARAWCTHCYALNAAAARRMDDLLSPMSNVVDAWSTYARCGVRVLVAVRPCASTRGEASSIPRADGGAWRRKWVRDFYWLRYRIAFRLDLLLKRKRFAGARKGVVA